MCLASIGCALRLFLLTSGIFLSQAHDLTLSTAMSSASARKRSPQGEDKLRDKRSPHGEDKLGEREGSRDLKDWVGEEKAAQMSHLFDKVYPFFHIAGQMLDKAWPIIVLVIAKLQALWVALEPYQPLDLRSCAMGLFLAFFGGRYLLLMAAIEAARQTGYKGFADNLAVLWTHFKEVRDHNAVDNKVDADNNGLADVEEMSRKELFSHKFKLFLRVTDPNAVMGAALGLWSAFLAVVATLRLQFAQTICLGVSIGAALEAPLQKFAAPVITRGVNPHYRQWVPFGIRQFCSFVGCTIAFMVTRLIGGFYSAVKGGQMFSLALLAYLAKRGHIGASHAEPGVYYSAIAGVVFLIGFYFQVATFFSLPFPLSFLLFPATVAENVLLYFVSSDVHTGSK